MHWLILILTSVLLGACASSIGSQLAPIETPPPREPVPSDQVDPAEITVPTTSPGFRAALPDLGAAPELNSTVWLNTDRPLQLAGLRGKVVLIDMWTFG